MTAKESELRHLLGKLSPAPKDTEKLIKELLLVSRKHDAWRQARPKASTPAQAEKMLRQVKHKLEEANKIFCNLFPHLLGLSQPVSLDEKRVGGAQTFTFPGSNRKYDAHAGPAQIGLFLFVDLLGTAQDLLDKEWDAFVVAQPTYANLQESSVIVAGLYCKRGGIKISASPNSQFYKIMQWLLGISDPRNVIRKCKPLIERGGAFRPQIHFNSPPPNSMRDT